eukprot:g52719.t1
MRVQQRHHRQGFLGRYYSRHSSVHRRQPGAWLPTARLHSERPGGRSGRSRASLNESSGHPSSSDGDRRDWHPPYRLRVTNDHAAPFPALSQPLESFRYFSDKSESDSASDSP